MIAGQEQPDAGEIIIGETVQLAYADQSRSLDGEKTVWEEISGGDDIVVLGERKFNSRAYVASFNFSGSDQQKLCKTLSGGERNRVHLAKTLRDRGNVIMLDEPTNDLDVNTLRALEDSLVNFAGCAVVVSHDRWFLDRIVTHILAFEGDGQVRLFLGSWSEYDEDQRKRLGDSGQVGSRKYRALKRG
jgi:ATPase subunit of ABC transporter with duplicated ATPase domains